MRNDKRSFEFRARNLCNTWYVKRSSSKKLAKAGLDYYNHNIDTSEEYYSKIISTRTYEDRLNTLENVRKANLKFVAVVYLEWEKASMIELKC